MPARVSPGKVTVLTQDGEVKVTIALDLTINLNTDGVQVTAQARKESKEEKEADWAIPDFNASPKLEFGKRE